MALLDVCRVFNQDPTFQPAMRVISSITQSDPVVITTVYDHQYHDGLIVRVDIPLDDGMQQLNQMTGTVTVIDDTSFSLPINTIDFDAFVIPEDPDNPGTPPPQAQICAMVVPIGEDNAILNQATRNVLPL